MVKAFNFKNRAVVIKGFFQQPLPIINAFCYIRRKFAKGVDIGITVGHSLFHFSVYTVHYKQIRIGLFGYIISFALYDVPLEELR